MLPNTPDVFHLHPMSKFSPHYFNPKFYLTKIRNFQISKKSIKIPNFYQNWVRYRVRQPPYFSILIATTHISKIIKITPFSHFNHQKSLINQALFRTNPILSWLNRVREKSYFKGEITLFINKKHLYSPCVRAKIDVFCIVTLIPLYYVYNQETENLRLILNFL